MTPSNVVTLAPKTMRSTYTLRQIIDEATWRAEREGTRLKRPYVVTMVEVGDEWHISVGTVVVTPATGEAV